MPMRKEEEAIRVSGLDPVPACLPYHIQVIGIVMLPATLGVWEPDLYTMAGEILCQALEVGGMKVSSYIWERFQATF